MQNKVRSSWALILGLIVLFTGLVMLNGTASSQATATQVATESATPTAAITRTPISPTPTMPTRTPFVQSPGEPSPVSASSLPRTVSVSGNGTAVGQPDRAVIVLGVRTEDEDASAALTDNNTQMQALITALRAAGVAQLDIRTLTIQMYPNYRPPSANNPNDPPTVSGFIALNTVEVTVRDLDTLGTLIDDAIAAGGNQIEGIRFELSDPSVLLDQAREAAMQDALHKAEQLSQLANARLGVVLTINESSMSPVPFMREMAQSSVGGQVPVSPGSQTVQVDIQVTWEIQ